MATYRQVHISFWQDPYIEDLSAKEKYFYLYLMTNSKTRQCGCYEISMKLIKYETGLTQQEIDQYITKLSFGNKIRYNEPNQEFLLLNWLKHNSFKSPKVFTCIAKELENIKTDEFIQYIHSFANGDVCIDRLLIDYKESIDTQAQKEEEKEKQKEEEYKKNVENFEMIFSTFSKSSGKADALKHYLKLLKQYTHEQLLSAAKSYSLTQQSKGEFSYQVNNFFGQKAYFKDYLEVEKDSTLDEHGVPTWFTYTPTEKNITQHAFNQARIYAYRQHVRGLNGD